MPFLGPGAARVETVDVASVNHEDVCLGMDSVILQKP